MMKLHPIRRSALVVAAFAAVPVAAQSNDPRPNDAQSNEGRPRSAKEAADAFTLDSVVPDPDTDVTSPEAPAAPPAVPAAPAAKGADVPSVPGLDTPIGDLIANYRTRAVLDRDLPGLSDDENLPKFRNLSLRQFQPLTGGQLTDALLAKVGKDLADGAAIPKRQRRTER